LQGGKKSFLRDRLRRGESSVPVKGEGVKVTGVKKRMEENDISASPGGIILHPLLGSQKGGGRKRNFKGGAEAEIVLHFLQARGPGEFTLKRNFALKKGVSRK